MDMSRVRLNDAIAFLGGDILTDNQPFSLQFANNAWRRLQAALVDLGVFAFIQDVTFFGVAASTGAPDFSTQVSLSWSGYNPGSGLAVPALPQTLISPLALWERISGSNGLFLTMDQVYKGLPRVPQGPWNRSWEWRGESIWMPGATGLTDLLVRFASYQADFVANSILAFANQPIPLMRSTDPLSWYLCSEVAGSRGDVDSSYFDKMADATMRQIFNRDSADPKAIAKPAELAKMRDRYTPVGNDAQSGGAQ